MSRIFNTPILFLIFNRPDTTQEVFDEIKKIKPKYLYVAADGPRKERAGEKEICEKTREIIKQIDWDCELKTLFREENLGCGKAISSAITWFFDNVERGIILEDDCLPHHDFFYYCDELLEKYKDTHEIKIISGDNFQNGIKRGNYSYYFSAYTHIWGWASWKRTWEEYSFSLSEYSTKQFKKALKKYSFSWSESQIWLDKFILSKKKKWQEYSFSFNKSIKSLGKNEKFIKKREISAWDYQLLFCTWLNNGVAILPNTNLISNIGFRTDSTHTLDKDSKLANIPTYPILPLTHPEINDIKRDKKADNYYYKEYLYKSPLQIFYRILKRNI